MSTGDTILFWVMCGIIAHGVGMGLVRLFRACQIWRGIRRRRLAARPPQENTHA